jgi:hypothetical protein
MAYLPVLLKDVDLAVTFTAPLATGAPLEPGNLLLRGVAGSGTAVLVRVQVEIDNTVTLVIFAASGATLGTTKVPGLVHAGAGTPLRVRAQAVGSTITAKVWVASGVEPRWFLSVTDPAAVVPGYVGVRSGVPVGNTNVLPVAFTLDNFTAVGSPQTLTVSPTPYRLLSGMAVHLWRPAKLAL